MIPGVKVSDGWVPIAVRDFDGVWRTLQTAPFTPVEARAYWDAGMLDMAQKRTGDKEFTLYIHARTAVDKQRQPVFFASPKEEFKSLGQHKRGRK